MEFVGYLGLMAAGAYVVFGCAGLALQAPRGFSHHFRPRIWQLCAATMVTALILAGPFRPAGVVLALALTATAFFFAAHWVREFIYLMGLSDEAFPGRHDKLIWVVLLLAFAPATLWAFRSYRLVHWPAPEPAEEPSTVTKMAPGPA